MMFGVSYSLAVSPPGVPMVIKLNLLPGPEKAHLLASLVVCK